VGERAIIDDSDGLSFLRVVNSKWDPVISIPSFLAHYGQLVEREGSSLDVDRCVAAVCVTDRPQRTEIGTIREDEENAAKPQRFGHGKCLGSKYA
jgi:hypothetical protein